MNPYCYSRPGSKPRARNRKTPGASKLLSIYVVRNCNGWFTSVEIDGRHLLKLCRTFPDEESAELYADRLAERAKMIAAITVCQ